MQNGYLKSFNGKFRDERLNVQWFHGLDDAQRSIEGWRISYIPVRPRSALCGQTTTQCAFDEQAASHAECLDALQGSGQLLHRSDGDWLLGAPGQNRTGITRLEGACSVH